MYNWYNFIQVRYTKLNTKTDARIIKTKIKLTDAFMQLISEKDFDDITVNGICEKSSVRRATFYKHFKDKLDFFKFIVASLREDFDKKWFAQDYRNDSEYFTEYAVSLVDFFEKNEKIIKSICNSPSSSSMFHTAVIQNYEDTVARIAKKDGYTLNSSVSVETFSMMLVGGVLLTLVNWIKSGKYIPKEVLKQEIKAIIKGI